MALPVAPYAPRITTSTAAPHATAPRGGATCAAVPPQLLERTRQVSVDRRRPWIWGNVGGGAVCVNGEVKNLGKSSGDEVLPAVGLGGGPVHGEGSAVWAELQLVL